MTSPNLFLSNVFLSPVGATQLFHPVARNHPYTDQRPSKNLTRKGIANGREPHSKRQRPLLRLKLRQRNQVNRIPRAAFQKSPIRPLARTQFASDAQKRIHNNPPHRRMIRIRSPEHAIFHRAIIHARRRSRASRAALVDHSQNMRLALPLVVSPRRPRLFLLHLTRNIFFNRRLCVRHQVSPYRAYVAVPCFALKPAHFCRPRQQCQSAGCPTRRFCAWGF